MFVGQTQGEGGNCHSRRAEGKFSDKALGFCIIILVNWTVIFYANMDKMFNIQLDIQIVQ